MLFNSYIFLFAFLPVTWVVYRGLAAWGGGRGTLAWLTLASLFFYAWWNPPFVLLIGASIVFNYSWGRLLERGDRTGLLALGIAVNLGALGWFKYAGFFARTVNQLVDAGVPVPQVFLPLGISFFTFQQIAFLVDAHRGLTREHGPLHYALFVTFFPQLIAGPIVHHADLIPQFDREDRARLNHRELWMGLSLLAIGLFKKVIVADSLSPYAAAVFDGRGVPGTLEAWGGVLAYTFQIYFDFSGYSDMAMGLGWLFGIRLPVNFAAPYRSTSIIDFWRTWHVTLSTFLRDYLYIALGGNRHGRARRYVNLLLTMLLGGLWHGAAWTFVMWGALHGAYLMVNHGWRALSARMGVTLPRPLGWLVTFLAVVVGWVFFRADSFDRAWRMLRSMASLHTVPWDGRLLRWALAPTEGFVMNAQLAWLVACALLTALAPVSWAWAQDDRREQDRVGPIVVGGMLAMSLLGLTRVSEFLYFQF